ncbi:MAG: hypothetical protein Q8O92_08580 [Candidatus Latescibacter sp.]|nr:hypothetical protein [Candidatus Latescibacter sp.]
MWKWIPILILCIVSGCAAKRPIIFRDPSYSDYSVLKNRCAFLLWDSINIKSMVQDFISAFDGNPASGEAFIRSFLVDCLTGKEEMYDWQNGKYRRLNFSSLDSIRTDLTLSQDAYGIATLTAASRESLSAKLASARVDYLIVIFGMTVTRGATASAMPMLGKQNFPGKGMTLVPGGAEQNFATMSAQVFVLRTATMGVVWNGFISGKWDIVNNFTRNTAKGVTKEFARDLYSAIK